MFQRILWKANRNLGTAVQLIRKMETSAYQKTIKEGKAEILLSTDKVFYNPVQEFNRDLSIAVLTVFSVEYLEDKIARAHQKAEKNQKTEKNIKEHLNKNNEVLEGDYNINEVLVTILEPLSATGLRAIRYAKEIPNVAKVIANDISRAAVAVINENILHNKVEKYVEANCDDACMLMYQHKSRDMRFAAIDLDPYGCPAIFLDSAVQAVQDGGMLLVTATDMAVLAGNSPETCYVKYGAVSLKTKCCHEMALRILLQSIQSHANRYGRYIVPMLSVSVDFYIRVFVKVYTGLAHCKKTTSQLSMVHHCTGCGNLVLQPLGGFKPNPTEKNPLQMKSFLPIGPLVDSNCVHCNQRHQMGGPIWSGPIHDHDFVNKVLSHVRKYPTYFGTAKRIEGMLSMIQEEIDVPLYYTMDRLVGTVHLESMKMVVLRSAILNAGYRVSYSHASKNSVKTDAPVSLLWDIVRTWEIEHPVKPERKKADPVTNHILSQKITHKIDFTFNEAANPVSRRDHCLRFQDNPAPHWGPGARAQINTGEKGNIKSRRKQGNKLKRQRSPSNDNVARKKREIPASDGGTILDGNTKSDENITN